MSVKLGDGAAAANELLMKMDLADLPACMQVAYKIGSYAVSNET